MTMLPSGGAPAPSRGVRLGVAMRLVVLSVASALLLGGIGAGCASKEPADLVITKALAVAEDAGQTCHAGAACEPGQPCADLTIDAERLRTSARFEVRN